MSEHLSHERQAQRAAMLVTYRPVYESASFWSRQPVWARRFPELFDYLNQRTADEVDDLERQLLPALPPRLAPWLRDIPALIQVPQQQAPPTPIIRGMRRQKQIQIGSFLHTMRDEAPAEVVDWCCGKGHLGRMLASTSDHTVTGFERLADLVQSGNQLSAGLTHHIEAKDVFQITSLPQPKAIALHACGALTDHLIKLQVAHGGEIRAALCCPHRRFDQGDYEPWHPATQALGTLEPFQLAMCTRDGARPLHKLKSRIAVDLIMRQQISDTRHDQPKISKTYLGGSLCALVQHLGERGLIDPSLVNLGQLEEEADKRLLSIRSWDLVRAGFRRLLEVTVWADRAMWLNSQGYDASLFSFCTREDSPRNLMLHAIKP